jgi:hypothetical protein
MGSFVFEPSTSHASTHARTRTALHESFVSLGNARKTGDPARARRSAERDMQKSLEKSLDLEEVLVACARVLCVCVCVCVCVFLNTQALRSRLGTPSTGTLKSPVYVYMCMCVSFRP